MAAMKYNNLGLLGLGGNPTRWGQDIGLRGLGYSQAQLQAQQLPLTPDEMAQQQQRMLYVTETEKAQHRLIEAQAGPQWWVDHDRVPPLEPIDRFLGWLDLELHRVRKRILGLT